MTANPMIDQLAADVRRRAADRPEGVTRIAEYIANRLHVELGGQLTDEQIGAVLLCGAGAAMSLAEEFGLSGRAVANGIAVAGEHLYHHPADAEPDCGG